MDYRRLAAEGKEKFVTAYERQGCHILWHVLKWAGWLVVKVPKESVVLKFKRIKK